MQCWITCLSGWRRQDICLTQNLYCLMWRSSASNRVSLSPQWEAGRCLRAWQYSSMVAYLYSHKPLNLLWLPQQIHRGWNCCSRCILIPLSQLWNLIFGGLWFIYDNNLNSPHSLILHLWCNIGEMTTGSKLQNIIWYINGAINNTDLFIFKSRYRIYVRTLLKWHVTFRTTFHAILSINILEELDFYHINRKQWNSWISLMPRYVCYFWQKLLYYWVLLS